MAQRKTPPVKATGSKSGATAKSGAAAKSAAAAKGTTGAKGTKTALTKSPPIKTAPKRPPARKPGKSIVNQKQRPWGLIATAATIVVFAVVVVVVAVATHKGSTDPNDRYRLPEVAAAKEIKGVQFKVEPNHTHVFTKVKYDTTPPTGGNHSQIWADCAGAVYPKAIANENATHMLEHGAVWITYNPSLAKSQIAILAKKVNGVDRMAMSPYPDLKTPISLQAWGYQLFVNSADDPRIDQFIAALRFNPKTTPENAAAVTCSDPQFKASPSTFGKPIFELSS